MGRGTSEDEGLDDVGLTALLLLEPLLLCTLRSALLTPCQPSGSLELKSISGTPRMLRILELILLTPISMITALQ